MRRLLGPIVLFLCLLVTPVSPAQASGLAVLRDCQAHGALTHHYSQQDYRDALANMPADLEEYSDCRSVIETAQAAAAHARANTGGGKSSPTAQAASAGSGPGTGQISSTEGPGASRGASRPANPSDLAAIDRAKREGGSLALTSGAVRPGADSVLTAGGLRSLPLTLRIVLVLLVAGAAAGAVLGLRRRVLARRRQS